jgi:two-component system, NtrC family, nitrogen regulation response regulator NtrX
MAKILIVDDESDIRELLSDVLKDEGYITQTANNAKSALEAMNSYEPDLVILDIWLEGSEFDGIGVLKRIKQTKPHLPVIMISGHGNIETAVDTIRHGAYDFIEKPFKAEKLLILANRAIEAASLSKENSSLKEQQQINSQLHGESKIIQSVIEAAKLIAIAQSRVLITGESGTGKEVLARMIHKLSSRKDKQFVTMHASSISEKDFEAEFFGVDDGKDFRIGILEKSNGGVLFIDEVSEMPLPVQAKLLKFLQEHTFYKLGNNKPIQADIRIIATSSKDLDSEVEKGKLNKSLLYRLNVAPIHLPPLRSRKDDIRILTEVLIKQLSEALGLQKIIIAEEAKVFLEMYAWPGNVRQLRNIIEWLMLMHGAENRAIQVQDLPVEITGHSSEAHSSVIANDIVTKPLKVARDMFEKEYLEAQLARFAWNISKTADFVGMERTALHRKIKALGIEEQKIKKVK